MCVCCTVIKVCLTNFCILLILRHVYMYVCMYVCVCVYIYIYNYIYI